jgi:NitT/TauT family transport system substrate-binding protein
MRPAALLVLLLPLAAGAPQVRKDAKPQPRADAGPGLTHVVLQTDWYAQPEHGGFYQALARGFYRREGLDVEIRQGGPATQPAQMVATGRADFAIADSGTVIVAASRGIPFVMLGAYMQRDPQAIMFHRESGIRGFRDLDGRNIMAAPGAPFIDIIERRYRIRVSVTPLDFGMSRFLARPDFIQQCFVTNEPYYVRLHGVDPGVLPISDCGFSPYRVWFASRRLARERPALARAFSRATIRGWTDYIGGDPAPANALIASLNPAMDAPFMAFSVRAMRRYRLVTGDPAAGEAVGRIRRERIATLIGQLSGIGLLDGAVTPDEVLDTGAP